MRTSVARAAIASPASAGILTVSATDCADAGLTQPFKRWNDSDYYKLVKSGSFEGGATGWQLNGGASVVSGNESFYVGGSTNSRSLKLPAGSSAVSPAVCVGVREPTLRLFARRNSGLLSTLFVEVQ